MGTALYFDMMAGISGDMCLGAFVDLGMDVQALDDILGRLPVASEFSLEVTEKRRNGMKATDVAVHTHEGGHHHRTMSDIRRMLEEAGLPARTKETALRAFTILAEAEARVHGTAPDEVHFHEAGAVDSIVDLVGCAFAMEYFDVDACWSSPFMLGTGTVTCAHGTLPVPVPAVLELVRGCPAVFSGIPTELTTPTGAAFIRAVVESPGEPPPEFTISSTGLGAGKKDTGSVPNMLRLIAGETETVNQPVVEISTDVDDSTPEMIGHLFDRILSAGALDCTVIPVMMKKGRPGNRISVLARRGDVPLIKKVIFEETTTLGVREWSVTRSRLRKRRIGVSIPGGTVSCVLGYLDGELVTISPEYEDCRKAAAAAGMPLKTVYRRAVEEAEKLSKHGTHEESGT